MRRRSCLPPVLALALAGFAACEQRPPAADQPIDPVFAVAESLRLEGRSAQALLHFRALRDSFAQTPDTQRYWRAQLGWADALMRQGKRDSAAAAIDVAMVLANGDPSREGRTRHTRSILLDRQGQFDSALAEATRALELARTAGDHALEANAYNALARIHSLSGRYREALAANERELAARQAYGAAPQHIANTYNELGIDYRHLGRFTEAADVYERALAIYRAAGNPEGQARVLNNLANLHLMSGKPDEALAHLNEAIPLTEQIADPRGQAFVLNGLATVYLQAGNLTAARAPLEGSLAAARRAKLPYNETSTLLNLGALELRTGSLDAAARALGRGLALADSLGYGRQRAGVRASLARLALARGEIGAARRWADGAVVLADSLGDPEAQYEAREARGTVLEAAGSAGATAAYLEAVDLLESWRGRLAMGDLRMGVAEPRLGAYEGAIRTLVARGRAEQAFLVAERARGRLLLELMAEHEGKGEARSRRGELRRLLQERYQALGAVRRADLRAQIERDIERRVRELELLEREERSAGEANVQAPAPVTLPELRSELLGSDRALLAYFWGDSAVYGWWITAGSARAARLGAADSLAALADFLRGAVETPSVRADWTAPARHAFDAFVAPLTPSGVAQVLVVADGPLAYLPLEVLVPGAGAPPWGATHRITYGPSASVLLALARAPRLQQWERAMLAIGNPAPTRRPARDGDAERVAPLRALPHAADEARSLRAMFRDEGADALLGRQATLERWLAMRPERYRYLHFAAHARVSDRSADRTALVLAGGPLGLSEIRDLPLRAELVTLSACETALGRRVRGEGVIGLPHAFLAAGAHGVVVTFWPVTDESASALMREFYGELRTGVAPDEALRRLREKWIRAGGADAHPSRWASFALIGGVGSRGATATVARASSSSPSP